MPAKKAKKGNTQKSKPVKAATKLSPKKASGKSYARPGTDLLKNLKQNEARLKLALDTAQMGVWEWDLTTGHVNWSDNILQLFGFPAKFENTFEQYMKIVYAEDQTRVRNNVNKAIKNIASCYNENRIVWPDGTIRWVESQGKVIAGRNGKASRMIGTIQDVTAKKEIEFDRETWKTRHELVSKSAGLVIYDYYIPRGIIVWSNNIQDVMGYTPDQLKTDREWIDLIHPDDRAGALSLFDAAEKELKAYNISYRFKVRSGTYIHVHDNGFFITDENDKPVRMLGMIRDVSDEVKAQQTIRESNRFREGIENAIPDILFVLNQENQRYIYANRNLALQTGYSVDDIAAMGDNFVQKIVHPDDFPFVPNWENEPAGTIREIECRVLMKGGGYRWFSARTTPFQWDKQGKISQILGIAQDITTRKSFITQLNKSEQSYRELFDTVGEAIYILDADGNILDINRGVCELYGCEKPDLMGCNLKSLSENEQNDFNSLAGWLKLTLEGKPQSFEFWGKRKSGKLFLQEVKFTRGSYFGKNIIIATGWDITQRRNAEKALRDSEQRFRTLQQASFGGIGLHDKGIIIDCNQGLCDISGYSYTELIGMNGLELISPEWRAFVLEKILTGYEKPYDVEGVRKDGSRYILEIHGKNIPLEGGTIRVTEFRDVTDRKRAEEKIVEQNAKLLALTEDLLRKNNQLEEFTQIVSHNLRAPVGNISTLVSFAENSSNDSERVEFFDLLRESITTTLSMLNDLNEVLKIKQNKNIELNDVDFGYVLQHVKSMLIAKVTNTSAEITADFSGASTIRYPQIYMESIFLNLLDNALKYSHPDRPPKIRLKTYLNRQKNTILEVSDNGLGLNLERYGHHVFKLRKTFHRHPESRGIGLFMIKNQVEAMGGEITISSRENEGSTFFINFNKLPANA
jgi:PAS domain S-box-containing protein